MVLTQADRFVIAVAVKLVNRHALSHYIDFSTGLFVRQCSGQFLAVQLVTSLVAVKVGKA